MQHVKGSDLVLGKFIRSFEVVGLDLFLLFFCLHFIGVYIACGKGRQQLIYLRLG